jgi:hypothetical protein
MTDEEIGIFLGTFDEVYLSLDTENSLRAAKSEKKVLQLGQSGDHSHSQIIGKGLKCYIDSIPTPCLADGYLIDALLSTGAYTHVDFIPIEKIKFYYNQIIIFEVPFTKEDVFSSNQFTLLEKRKIMKAINNYTTISNCSTFYQFLSQEIGLEDGLCLMILFSICFTSDLEIPINDGLNRCRKFISSVNKFGQKSPILYPTYGSNEISQAFCRVCAVKGGTQILNAKDVSLVNDLIHFSFEGSNYRAKFSNNSTVFNNSIFYRTHFIDQIVSEESCLNVYNSNKIPVYELVLKETSLCIPPGHTLRYFWSKNEKALMEILSAKEYSISEISQVVCNTDIFY